MLDIEILRSRNKKWLSVCPDGHFLFVLISKNKTQEQRLEP